MLFRHGLLISLFFRIIDHNFLTFLTAKRIRYGSCSTHRIPRLVKYVKDSIPGLIDFGIKIVIAVVLFFIGTRLIKLIQKLIRKAMEKHGSEVGAVQFVGSFVKAALYFLLIFILAGYLGADTASIVALVGSAAEVMHGLFHPILRRKNLLLILSQL